MKAASTLFAASNAMLAIDSMTERRANRPHYHIWKKARTGRIFYRIAAPCTHRQSAQRAVKKLGLPRDQVMVLECRDPKCAPKIG
ncbi:MAG: hypothetical protein OXE85_05080 [Roseovarius sp.]|nr:hypothetical protein [Roseovarius sp.]